MYFFGALCKFPPSSAPYTFFAYNLTRLFKTNFKLIMFYISLIADRMEISLENSELCWAASFSIVWR